MNNTKVVVLKKQIGEYSGDLLVAFVSLEDSGAYVVDEIFLPLLHSLSQYKEFNGKKETFLLLYPPFSLESGALQCRRLLLVGLGNIQGLADLNDRKELLRLTGGLIAAQSKNCKTANIAICLPSFCEDLDMELGEHLIEGILLGDYRFTKYKTGKKDNESFSGLKKIEVLTTKNIARIRRRVVMGGNGARSTVLARDMANEPGNGWTPSHFARLALDLSRRLPLSCRILDKSEIADLGMGGIIAVNQGSEEPPKLVVLEYAPEKSDGTVLLVGKGLTFDSGGVSLKPAQGMMDMKYDMCGGAAVVSAMETIALEKPTVRVVAIVPATDNMPGGGALKPGDVITQYNGVTSEIESTDAEGRLILADALAYGIEQYQPDCVIDIATLTGAVVVALGHHYTGLLSNNDQLAEKLIAAGKTCGEPLWRLPMGEMYFKQIKSQIADIKNTGGKTAGCITAAEFLHQFVGKTPWAHLDIAGTAWDYTEKSYIPKGPSGVGVRTLIDFIRNWKSNLL